MSSFTQKVLCEWNIHVWKPTKNIHSFLLDIPFWNKQLTWNDSSSQITTYRHIVMCQISVYQKYFVSINFSSISHPLVTTMHLVCWTNKKFNIKNDFVKNCISFSTVITLDWILKCLNLDFVVPNILLIEN